VQQYYGIATTTIFFYEYFAMLPDEVSLRLSGPFAVFEAYLAIIDSIRVVVEQNLGYVELSCVTANV